MTVKQTLFPELGSLSVHFIVRNQQVRWERKKMFLCNLLGKKSALLLYLWHSSTASAAHQLKS